MVAAAATVVVAAAGLAIAASSDDSTGSNDSAGKLATMPITPTAAVRAVEPDAMSAFRLLRNEAPSPVPADVAAQVASPRQFGRNAALARTIDTPTGTGWVIPGAGFICIAVPDSVDGWSTSCLPTKVAAERGLGIGLTKADGRSVETLLVPDGASAGAIVGGLSTVPRNVTAKTKWKTVKVGTNGVATARTNAPDSLRVMP
jgi:hypothetical protein